MPHLLVGGKTFHDREEVETIRAALAAIEWPDDELSVFATLRGALFAIGDEELLEWKQPLSGSVLPSVPHPGRPLPPHLAPIADGAAAAAAAASPAQLRAGRRHDPGAARTPRARTSGSCCGRRASRRWPTCCTSPSSRGSTRRTAASRSAASSTSCATPAETAQAAEAPILEEGSDGVRLMTVHKAKGLEFPVVILADLTCKLSPRRSRPLARRGEQPVRAEARRLGADRSAAARRRGSVRATRPRRSGSPTSPRRARAICSSSRPSATGRTTAAGSIR